MSMGMEIKFTAWDIGALQYLVSHALKHGEQHIMDTQSLKLLGKKLDATSTLHGASFEGITKEELDAINPLTQ